MLAKSGKGSLNASHSVEWVKNVRDIMQYLVDQDLLKEYQFLDASKTYQPFVGCR